MDRAEPQVVYGVPRGWELSEETMPESVAHRDAVTLLQALLLHWARGRNVQIVANLAVRWDEAHPSIGLDPDVAVLSPPPPPDGEGLRSVRTWEQGHSAPLLAIEVVSTTNPKKDYVIAPDKYAASGTGELWIFDPLLAGPRNHGGPFRLQVWQRDEEGRLVRTYAGDGPGTTRVLGAHLVVTDDGHKLRVADDAEGKTLWLTGEEAERAEKEAALARVAALEEALRRRG
jgi:Uma2 family endonuclease